MILFDLDTENSFGTFYSSVTLLFCSILLTLIACARKKINEQYLAWLFLGFIFLSLDEALKIHERVSGMVHRALDTDQLLYVSWVIPYGIASIAIGLLYLLFLFSLPAKTGILFVVAGGIYILGALGFEVLAALTYGYSHEGFGYFLIATLEEVLEMVGILIFIYALMSYIDSELEGLQIGISSKAQS
jgi:hypothetical protein